MADATSCSSCGADFRDGVFGHNAPLPIEKIDALNLAFDEDKLGYCRKCQPSLIDAPYKVSSKIALVQNALLESTQRIPILSLNQPFGWEFDSLSIVTAQTTTGTGVFSEVASAFTDLFGTQSKTYNSKIKAGEEICKASVRVQTAELGGNAIIGADIDYAEVGGQRAMLMVCMTGTAVRIRNVDDVQAELDVFVQQVRRNSTLLVRLQKAQAALS